MAQEGETSAQEMAVAPLVVWTATVRRGVVEVMVEVPRVAEVVVVETVWEKTVAEV